MRLGQGDTVDEKSHNEASERSESLVKFLLSEMVGITAETSVRENRRISMRVHVEIFSSFDLTSTTACDDMSVTVYIFSASGV